MNRSIETRFQRLGITRSESWGDAPGWDESAPLALRRNAGGDSFSANGAMFISSLGQGPRISGGAKSLALKVRFFVEMCP